MSKNNILVVIELKNDNLGDKVISETFQYLIEKIGVNCVVEKVNLFPNKDIMTRFKTAFPKTDELIQKCQKYPFLVQILEFSKWWRFQKRNTPVYNFYKKSLQNAKAVIFAGGGLIKYTRENFWNYIYSIVTHCNRKNIPVYFNAIGVEGYDGKNFYSQLLKYSLNKKCVKKITTRDDIVNLRKYTKAKNIMIIGDSALWARECYDIEEVEKTDIIGIGVIRGKIFTDYNIDYPEEKLVDLYVNLIRYLEFKGYKWQLFCNGLKADYNLAMRVLEKLSLREDERYLAQRPENSEELIKIITKYKATISARLHANIIAVSYNIPTVGLIWNDKLKLFGEILGCPDRFVERDKFLDPEFIVKQLEEAIQKGYNSDKIKTLKNSTLISLNEFIQSFVNTEVS